MLAADGGHWGLASVLTAANAEVRCANKDGTTALMLAARQVQPRSGFQGRDRACSACGEGGRSVQEKRWLDGADGCGGERELRDRLYAASDRC
jgi:hypothetical protein